MKDALLLVDVVNDFRHEDGEVLLASFRARHATLAAELDRARGAMPVVYANDDWGRWDANAPGLVRSAIERGRGGDLPPRGECATLWLDQLLERLPHIELTLLIGQHAQRHFLGKRRGPSLAATVAAWRDHAPRYLPLPHPSPRNQPWFKRHPWFERELLPVLRERVAALVGP